MAFITSKEQLKEYIKSELGFPVINVEITDEQLDNAILYSIEKYTTQAYSGYEERYYLVEASGGSGLQEFILPPKVFAVLDCNTESSNTAGNMYPVPAKDPFSFDMLWSQMLNKNNSGSLDILTWELTNQFASTLGALYSKKITFDYNAISRMLYLFEKLQVGQKMLLHVYQKLSIMEDDEISNIYSDRWVRTYATERARLRWGQNLSKYEGSSLPQGLQLNSAGIISEAKEALDKLEEELNLKYTLPTDFFIG